MASIAQCVTVEKEEVAVEKKEVKPRKTKRAIFVAFQIGDNRIGTFKELLKVLEDAFSEEIPLQIHNDGLAIRVMDASRVQMANYFFSQRSFDEFVVGNKTGYKQVDLPVNVTVPLSDILYAIDEAGRDAIVRFEINAVYSTVRVNKMLDMRKPDKCPNCKKETLSNQLPWGKRGKKENRYKCICGWRGKVRTWKKKARVYETDIEEKESRFTITVKTGTTEKWDVKLLEPSTEEQPPLPLIRLNTKFKLVAADFRAKIERLQKRMDHISLLASNEGLRLKGASDYLAGDVEIKRGSDMLLDVDCIGEEKAIFSIAALLSILPKKKVSDLMTLEYSTDMPVRITAQTDLEESVIEYYLAPRIEDD